MDSAIEFYFFLNYCSLCCLVLLFHLFISVYWVLHYLYGITAAISVVSLCSTLCFHVKKYVPYKYSFTCIAYKCAVTLSMYTSITSTGNAINETYMHFHGVLIGGKGGSKWRYCMLSPWHTLCPWWPWAKCVCVCGGASLSTLLAQKRSTGACFLAHSLIYLQPPPPLSPLTHAYTHAHTRTEVARVQSRVHKDPSELNMLASFQWISHLSCKAHNRAESPCPSYLVHPPTHTHMRTHK